MTFKVCLRQKRVARCANPAPQKALSPETTTRFFQLKSRIDQAHSGCASSNVLLMMMDHEVRTSATHCTLATTGGCAVSGFGPSHLWLERHPLIAPPCVVS